MPPFDKIADQTGHLQLDEEGAIISVSGLVASKFLLWHGVDLLSAFDISVKCFHAVALVLWVMTDIDISVLQMPLPGGLVCCNRCCLHMCLCMSAVSLAVLWRTTRRRLVG